MPNTVTSPNMNIVVPVNLTDPSPDWGARLQAALFSTVDAHDHSSGKGVQITPLGMNINADLSFSGTGGIGAPYNATALRSSRYTSQGSPLALGSDVGCVYVSGGELWYNDLSSRQVQLTSTGAVKSAPQALSFKNVVTSYTILSTDPYQLFYAQTVSSAVAIALPSSATLAVGRTYYFYDAGQNASANNITITPNGTDTINGVNAPIVILRNAALVILTTNAAGQWSANISLLQPPSPPSLVGLGTGTTTLSTGQLAADVIQFNGTLTGAVTIVFPNAAGRFVCDFSQVVMGANTIAVKSGTTTSATMAAANIGSTATINQLSFVYTYGGNTIRLKA